MLDDEKRRRNETLYMRTLRLKATGYSVEQLQSWNLNKKKETIKMLNTIEQNETINGTPAVDVFPALTKNTQKQKKIVNSSVVTNTTFSDGSTVKSIRETFEALTLTEIDNQLKKRAEDLAMPLKYVDVYHSYKDVGSLQANATFEEGSWYE